MNEENIKAMEHEVDAAAAYDVLEEAVPEAYRAMEDGVVGAYKKIEDTVVGAYQKIEDGFVGKFLTREGETVEEAKNRLKK